MSLNNFPYKFNLIINRTKVPHKTYKFDSSLSLTLPSSYDLSDRLPIIYDQGNLGSCTANSVAWLYRYYKTTFSPSRLFIYYYSRLFDQIGGDNSVKIDDGTTLKQAMNVIKKKGVVANRFYPYIIKKYAKRPPAYLNIKAKKRRIKSYQLVNQDIDSMKSLISSGTPFVFGFIVFSSFLYSSTESTGIIPYPDIGVESVLGGHALVAVGYDDSTQLIKCVNSYGRSWGDNGYLYMPYNYILNPSFTDDLWMISNFGSSLNKNIKKNKMKKNKLRKNKKIIFKKNKINK